MRDRFFVNHLARIYIRILTFSTECRPENVPRIAYYEMIVTNRGAVAIHL